MKKAIFLFSLLIAGHAFSQTNTPPAFITDSLDSYVNRALQEWNIPGAAVCIVKDGKVVVMKGYGVKEAGTADKVDENTLFMIGSISKPFTATALAMLDGEKAPVDSTKTFSLNDRVQNWLPGFSLYFKPTGEHAIIRDLLCHRIGFDGMQGTTSLWRSNFTRKQIIERMEYMKPTYVFRTTWGYSNAAFVAAGEIIPAVTGMQWEDFLKEKIFIPLGMNRTLALSTGLSAATNKSAAHTLDHDRPVKIPYYNIDNLAAAGGICSSINDMSHWVVMELEQGQYNEKQVLPAAAIKKTWFPHAIMGDGANIFNTGHFLLYGLGWFMQEYNGSQVLAHTGGVDGFISSVTLVPEKKLGIIVLTNTDQNNFPRALFWEIMDAWMGLPYRNYSKVYLDMALEGRKKYQEEDKKLKDSAALKPAALLPLTAYTGRYEDKVYGEIDIVAGNDELQMKWAHHPQLSVSLKAIGGDRFYTSFSDPDFTNVVAVFKTAQGKAGSFTFTGIGSPRMEQLEFIRKTTLSEHRIGSK